MQTRLRFDARQLAVAAAVIALVYSPKVFSDAETNPSPPPKVGDKAKEFKLKAIDGKDVSLGDLTSSGPVAVLVLRGYPGYQCPICSMQVGDYLSKAKRFEAAQAKVVLVYPGSADGLLEHAKQFVRGRDIPDNFHLLLDPDYSFVNAYGLRWDEARETAYPSTFVIDSNGVVRFAKISRSHGDRTNAAEALAAIASMKK